MKRDLLTSVPFFPNNTGQTDQWIPLAEACEEYTSLWAGGQKLRLRLQVSDVSHIVVQPNMETPAPMGCRLFRLKPQGPGTVEVEPSWRNCLFLVEVGR